VILYDAALATFLFLGVLTKRHVDEMPRRQNVAAPEQNLHSVISSSAGVAASLSINQLNRISILNYPPKLFRH